MDLNNNIKQNENYKTFVNVTLAHCIKKSHHMENELPNTTEQVMQQSMVAATKSSPASLNSRIDQLTISVKRGIGTLRMIINYLLATNKRDKRSFGIGISTVFLVVTFMRYSSFLFLIYLFIEVF